MCTKSISKTSVKRTRSGLLKKVQKLRNKKMICYCSCTPCGFDKHCGAIFCYVK